MPSYFLSIGSNCNGRSANVERALKRLVGLLPSSRFSSIYETPDIHGGPSLYMNAVMLCEWPSGPGELEKLAKGMETEFGRDEEARRRGEVPLDIDVVTCDDLILRERDFHAEFFQIGYRELVGKR